MTVRRRRVALLLGILSGGLLADAAAAPGAHAQTVRMTGATTVRYVSARGLREDSVAITETLGDGVLRQTESGTTVRCIAGAAYCGFLAAGDVLHAAPLTQDLTLSMWGIGRGIRLHASLRARLPLFGDAELWPRADDRFDALEAWLEIARPIGRVRIGRQWQGSGLGTYGYDGLSLLSTRGAFTAEAFGGWSLVRGLAEPITDPALAAVEPFAPDERGILLGSRVQWRTPAAGATLAYQREIRSDRLALYSERASASAFVRRGVFTADALADADVATRELNHLRLQASARLLPQLRLEAYGRRYRPYFDLWTIWGAFTPVGFDELGGALHYTPAGLPFDADVRVARRDYHDTEASLALAPMRAEGWRFQAALQGTPAARWSAEARYGADVGFGAARSELDAGVRRELGERSWVGVTGTVFQRGSEFQLARGVVVGSGVEGSWAPDARTRATAHLAAYRHLVEDDAPGVDWTQVRAQLRLDWTVGPEPGLPASGRRAP